MILTSWRVFHSKSREIVAIALCAIIRRGGRRQVFGIPLTSEMTWTEGAKCEPFGDSWKKTMIVAVGEPFIFS